MFIVLPLAGALSDRFGRLPIYLIGAGLTILTAFPIFWLIDTKSPALIALALSLGLGTIALMYGPLAAFYSEMFPPRVRYSGTSLGYQGSVILAGLAPFIATALLGIFGPVSWPIVIYIVVMGIITIISASLAGETRTAAVIAAETPSAKTELVGASKSKRHRQD
jgi:MFS family permease